MRKAIGMPYPLHQWTMNQMMDGLLEHPEVIEQAKATHAKALEKRIKHRNGTTESDAAAEVRAIKEARKPMRALSVVERDKKAERGTEVHEAIALGKDLKELDESLVPFVENYARAVIELGLQPLLAERQVFNKSMGYAGSFDLVGRLAKRPASPIAVIDLKTGNTYPEHAIQGYSYLKGEFVGAGDLVDHEATKVFRQASQVGILRLGEGAGDYEYIDVKLDEKLHRAWFAVCVLSNWFVTTPTVKEVSV